MAKKKKVRKQKRHPKKIFSGGYSSEMWDDINNAESTEDLQDALYFVCCRLQELESKLAPLFEQVVKDNGS